MLHDGEAPGFIVTGLAKFTRYQFFLVPFYKTLDGRPSNSRTARTLEDGKLHLEVIHQAGFHLLRICMIQLFEYNVSFERSLTSSGVW